MKSHQILIVLCIYNGWEIKDIGLSSSQIKDATVALEKKKYITSESGEQNLTESGHAAYFRFLAGL